MSVCLFEKDLANHWTDWVHLMRVGPGKVYNYLGGGYLHPPKRNHPKKIPQQKLSLTFSFKIEIKKLGYPIQFPSSQVPLEASRCKAASILKRA